MTGMTTRAVVCARYDFQAAAGEIGYVSAVESDLKAGIAKRLRDYADWEDRHATRGPVL